MPSRLKSGKLYIVATPIGHPEDITLRAMKILGEVDAVICEEIKLGSRLLKKLQIEKPLIVMNEHNEAESVQNILIDIMAGKSFALVSDCGTPVFADPGRLLITTMNEMDIKVIPIPGPSSLMAAISVCTFNLDQYQFVGFLPPKSDQRIAVLNRVSKSKLPLILMDTPYRLTRTLEEVIQIFGKKQSIFVACDLTLPGEVILHGTAEDILKKLFGQKKEFILIIDKPQRRY